MKKNYLKPNEIYCAFSEIEMYKIEPNSISLSVWSPPYNVGKDYEKGQSFEQWKAMLDGVIKAHFHVLKAGGFMIINIADILCFPDETMPKIQIENPSLQKVKITKEEIIKAKEQYPDYNRRQLGMLLGCSEQNYR